jgi:hypothetical protein
MVDLDVPYYRCRGASVSLGRGFTAASRCPLPASRFPLPAFGFPLSAARSAARCPLPRTSVLVEPGRSQGIQRPSNVSGIGMSVAMPHWTATAEPDLELMMNQVPFDGR